MNELSLFSGAGGGLLGTMLLGFRPIGYVECDDYCQRIIAARIRDGILPDAPIFGDIRAFIRDGYAASYTGLVDIVTAGFPCQPFSVAGKQKGADDERNMWPVTAECIGIVRPRFVLLENVPGIRKYLPVVVRDLRRLGYEVSRPLILGADDVGAPHRRKRVWIVAKNPFGKRRYKQNAKSSSDSPQRQDHERNGRGMDGTAEGREGINAAARVGDSDVTDADSERFKEQRRAESIREGNSELECGGWSESWPEVAARLCRVDDGVAHRVDRLKALGNGQVPQVVRAVWRMLTGEVDPAGRGEGSRTDEG